MATWKVAPALAAGCAAILKPSELSSMYVLVNISELAFRKKKKKEFAIFMPFTMFSIPELVWS